MKRLFPVAALVALCVSCSPTLYDAALSDSARTVLKLTKDTGSSVVLDYHQNSVPADLTFYPRVTSAGFDYTIGFVVASSGSDVSFQAVAYDAGSQMLEPFGYSSGTVPNQDPRYPTWSAWPAKDASFTNAYILLLTFDALYPASGNGFFLLEGQAAAPHVAVPTDSGIMGNRVSASLPSLSATVIGAAVEASNATSFDTTSWLVRDVSLNYAEVFGSLTSTPIAVSSLRGTYPYALSFIPSGLTHVQYFHDLNEAGESARFPNASFASWYDTGTGKWVCYRWAENPVSSGIYPYVQLPVDHRVDALLSTGQLLSTEDGTGRLYSRDGNLLATFPLGTLRFLSEEYVGGEARTYFTQCLAYDNTVHLTTYYIRTSDLATLGS